MTRAIKKSAMATFLTVLVVVLIITCILFSSFRDGFKSTMSDGSLANIEILLVRLDLRRDTVLAKQANRVRGPGQFIAISI